MKNKLVILPWVIVSLLLMGSDGCGDRVTNITAPETPAPPPVHSTASFTATINALSVKFINTSMNAAFFEWDFGDLSAFVSDTDPLHTYAAAGSYTVRLRACPTADLTGPLCDTASARVTVTDTSSTVGSVVFGR